MKNLGDRTARCPFCGKVYDDQEPEKILYEDGRVDRNEFYRVCPNCGYIWIIEMNDMKDLGGISIDFTGENGKYDAEIGLNVNGVPGKVIAKALVSVVARLARDNKRLMDTLIDELAELVGLEDETENESGIAEQ